MKTELGRLANALKNLSYDELDDVVRQLNPYDVMTSFLRVHDSDDQPESDWIDTLRWHLYEVRSDPE